MCSPAGERVPAPPDPFHANLSVVLSLSVALASRPRKEVCTVFDLLWYLSVESGATDCCCLWWSFLFWHQHDSRSSDEHVGASVLRECGLRIVFLRFATRRVALLFSSCSSFSSYCYSFSSVTFLCGGAVGGVVCPGCHVTVIYLRLRSQASIASSSTSTRYQYQYSSTAVTDRKSAAPLKGLVSLFFSFFLSIFIHLFSIDSDPFVVHYVWLCLLRILLNYWRRQNNPDTDTDTIYTGRINHRSKVKIKNKSS